MSLITVILLAMCVVPLIASFLKPSKSKDQKKLPGPKPWPLIGNLFHIGKYQDVTEAFINLSQQYGDAFFLKLGVFDAVVVSGWARFKDILITRGNLFDARPVFSRYDILFHNDRNNAIAFCDGSETHYKNRSHILIHTFMRNGTLFHEKLEEATLEEIFHVMEDLKTQIKHDNKVNVKPILAAAIGKAFVKYLCSVDVDKEDPLFKQMIEGYDEIFQEINQGCVGDVLPFLMPFINKNKVVEASHRVREFVVQRVFEPRQALRQKINDAIDDNNNCNEDSTGKEQLPNDLLNSFLDFAEKTDEFDAEKTTYSFEDILGGHSAIANFSIRLFSYVAQNPEVQRKIREEANSGGSITMTDKLPYTEATIWEALRFASSGIVPHVASQDTTIDDCPIKKGTLIMFNNYDLHFREDLWEQPQKFMPERFITKTGGILKPEYFVPFSTGKRSCLGVKLTMNILTVVLAKFCENFEITADPSENYNFERGCLSVGTLYESAGFIFNNI